MLKLEVHTHQGQVVTFPLEDGRTLSIGRHASNDITLDHSSVSRSHCLIYVGEDCVEIEDLGSTNGVRLSGERVEGRVEVEFDEEMLIGNVKCFLRSVSEAATADETTVQAWKQNP